MNLDKYPVVASDSAFVYEFVSEGKNGKVAKIIVYSEIHSRNFYNLGFGDKNEVTGEIDDKIATNNGDRDRVLATVASTLYLFTNKFPEAMIVAAGSTKARTRLYRIGISNHLNLIRPDFEVFGLTSANEWEPFDSKREYLAFLVKRKRSNFDTMKKAKSKNNNINNNKGAVILRVDDRLDEYLKKDLFKEKVDRANEILRTTKLPKFED